MIFFCLTLGAPFTSSLHKYSCRACTPGFGVIERIGGIEERRQSGGMMIGERNPHDIPDSAVL